jgi:hypothetical protein
MTTKSIRKGDQVLLRSEVTHISDDGVEITIWLKAFNYPISIRTDCVENVEGSVRGKPRGQMGDIPD